MFWVIWKFDDKFYKFFNGYVFPNLFLLFWLIWFEFEIAVELLIFCMKPRAPGIAAKDWMVPMLVCVYLNLFRVSILFVVLIKGLWCGVFFVWDLEFVRPLFCPGILADRLYLLAFYEVAINYYLSLFSLFWPPRTVRPPVLFLPLMLALAMKCLVWPAWGRLGAFCP